MADKKRKRKITGPFQNTNFVNKLSKLVKSIKRWKLPDLLVVSKSALCKWYKKLGSGYKWSNKKMQVYQQLDVDIVSSSCNFITNEIPVHVFSCEF